MGSPSGTGIGNWIDAQAVEDRASDCGGFVHYWGMGLQEENQELRRLLALSEEALRGQKAIEAQHAFLLKLGDEVRKRSSAEAKIEAAARLLARHVHQAMQALRKTR